MLGTRQSRAAIGDGDGVTGVQGSVERISASGRPRGMLVAFLDISTSLDSILRRHTVPGIGTVNEACDGLNFVIVSLCHCVLVTCHSPLNADFVILDTLMLHKVHGTKSSGCEDVPQWIT